MENLFGFIGAGNMGSALARAAVRKLPARQIIISNRTAAKAEALAEELGARAVSNAEAAQSSRYIFLGVKPQMMEALFNEIRPVLNSREEPFVLVSMAAGISMERVCELAGRKVPVIRIMPNTPCAVGEGVILVTKNDMVSEEDYQYFSFGMSGAGRFVPIGENLFDAGGAISGCGPAFVAMFIDALADGGVRCGLPRKVAIELASQTLAGTSKLQLETGKHPGVMKDEVCSPAGSTIEGVLVLEEAAFRGAVSDAVIASCEKSTAMGKK